MADITFEQNKLVEGFSFSTEKDSELAAQEQKKIQYLEEHIHYDNHTEILNIYRKAIHDRIFKTPLGILYLRHLQEFLLSCEDIADKDIIPIPLYKNYGGEFRENTVPARNRLETPKKKKSIAFPVSVILNMILIIAVIAMFVIALNADQPNLLNYEKEITNRYASWEQELTQREQIIREKERELKITE